MSLPAISPPAEALRPFVTGYVDLEVPLPAGQHLEARIIPLGCPALLWLFASEITVTDGPAQGFRTPPASFVGQITRSGGTAYTGPVRGFLVQLAPAGAFDLLGCEVSRYQNLTVPLAEAMGPALAADWSQQLAQAPDFAARCRAADGFLLALHQARQPHPGVGAAAAGLLTRHHGTLEMSEVAQQLGIAVRTLLRRFGREVGMAPKTFARLLRFRAAHAFLQEPTASWADAVLRFGYSDQSHLLRDYRDFAGESPSQYQTEARVIDRIFGQLDDERA
jgi:AraC-like DNA-binding protein